MTVQVEFWQLVLLLVTFLGAAAGVGSQLLRQTQKHLDERFDTQEKARTAHQGELTRRLEGLEQVTREETVQWQRVERDMLQRFASLPHTYVMRDDYIRGQSILEAKLDGLADKIEKTQLRHLISGRES